MRQPNSVPAWIDIQRVAFLSVVAALSLASASCAFGAAPTPAATPRTITVEIDDYRYLPETLEIAVGTTVVWRNRDGDYHTVTNSPTREVPLKPDKTYDLAIALFNLNLVENGGTAQLTFGRAGTYFYYCLPHNWMRGTVVVR